MALFVFHKNSRSPLNRGWFFVCLLVGLWSFGLWGVVSINDPERALAFQYILDASAILIPVAYFRFTVVLLNIESKKRREVLISCILAIVIVVLSFTSFFKSGVTEAPYDAFKYWVSPGPIYIVFPIVFSLLMAYSIILSIFNYPKLRGAAKIQVFYVVMACSVGFLGGITNFLPQLGGVYPVGNYFVVLYILIVVYAIVQHRLMGIRVLLSKVFIILILGLTAFGVFYLLAYIGENSLGGIYSPASLVLGAIIFLILAQLLFPFLAYIQKSSDYLFFQGDNPSKLIKDLSLKIGGVIDLKKLIRILNKDFKKLIGAEAFAVVYVEQISSEKDGKITLVVAKGNRIKRTKIDKKNELYKNILKEKKLIVRDEIKDDEKRKGLLKEMDKNCARIAAPLVAQKNIVGVMIIGEKVTQDAYTKEDIESIEIISSQVAIAIENTRLYKETMEFNERLKREIKKATEDLQSTNQELKEANEKLVGAYAKLHKLDRAKSEFLSIASHQLRTPLTSIKGFTSLLIEGTYGQVSNKVKEVLQKIFLSNERLIRLVEDLLNISRIESGRFVFDVKENDITTLVKEVVDSFAIPAKANKMSLRTSLPKVKIRNLHFDKNKLREVISNLIDNAIKYSGAGTVQVKLENKRDRVRVSVKDRGVGIPKEELEYIFDKFQRGKDVNNVHTEGVGLGLYVCKKVVESHKGKIWAESEGLEKGSSFIFELRKGLKAKDMAKKVE